MRPDLNCARSMLTKFVKTFPLGTLPRHLIDLNPKETLDVAGADAIRTWYDAFVERRMHEPDDGLRKTESKDAIGMD
ncbi:hypothetical protein TNCV_4253151 [Trichonephila clavipes]|nr:hypothetical protein TNCV_4253151 [Trichonephila clavipes]